MGSMQSIPELLKKETINNVLVVTGPTVGKRLAPKILTELDVVGIANTLFTEVEANHSFNTGNRIQKLYRENAMSLRIPLKACTTRSTVWLTL